MTAGIRELFERTGHGCLVVESNIGVVHICHAADEDIANFADKPVLYQWQLVQMPTAPLVRLEMLMLDDPDQAFPFESFQNVADEDQKYTKSFGDVFRSEGININCTPVKAPNAYAYAERWVKSLRGECLDNLLIINEAYLRNVLNEYLTYYNLRRPHQGLEQQFPIPRPSCPSLWTT